MERNEISLGKVDESNLIFTNQTEIGVLDKVSYNIIEEDIVEYLRKVRRKNNNLDFEEIIKKYIKLSELDSNSEEYLKILLSIPYDFLKDWYKYKYKKKSITLDEELENLKKTFIYENEIL